MNDKTKNAQQSDDGFSLEEWVASNPKAFDRYSLYMQHAAPVVEQLIAVCREHRLPFSLVVGHTQQEDGHSAVASASHFPTAAESQGEVIMAMLSATGNVGGVVSTHRADIERLMRLQAFFPKSGSVH